MEKAVLDLDFSLCSIMMISLNPDSENQVEDLVASAPALDLISNRE